jgi:hypothetical protein
MRYNTLKCRNFLLQILKGQLYLKEWSASGLDGGVGEGGGAIHRILEKERPFLKGHGNEPVFFNFLA